MRRWTDDDLRRAIAASHSWRGTARFLGLRGTSAGTIRALKKCAETLDLNTAHFTGQRPWSDQDLKRAIAESDSWAGVIRSLGTTDRGDVRTRLRGHALRLGADLSHLERPKPPTTSIHPLTPQIGMLRFAAESIATAWFALCSVSVAAPLQPGAYDLLVTLNDGVKRVQVKTTTHATQGGSWVAQIGRRPYVLDKSASRAPYDPEDLDYFFIVDGDGRLYFIPINVVAGRTSICLGAYSDFIAGDASSLMKAGLHAVTDRSEAETAL